MFHGKKFAVDLFLIILIIAFNPVLLTFILDAEFTQPDTFSYIAEAQNLYKNLEFHTGPLGHIDNSIILPPLYPALIAIVTLTGIQPLDAALLISQIAAILFSLFAYFFVRTYTNRLIAFTSVICIQLTYIYFNFATLALTESLFLFLLILFFLFSWHTIRNYSKQGLINFFILGVISSMIFLTRELGIATLILIFIIIFTLQFGLNSNTQTSRNLFKQLFITCIGFSILTVPYYSIRTLQTGQGPFTQKYRLEQYVVETDSQDIINRIESIKNKQYNNYSDIYQSRRLLMELLPDGSEMLDYVAYTHHVDGNQTNLDDSTISHMQPTYFEKIIQNIFILMDRSGIFIFILFLIFAITIFLFTSEKTKQLQRIFIPAFIAIYILLLSVFTGMVMRYIEILVPILIIYICMELYNLATRLRDKYSIAGKLITIFLIASIPAIVLAGSPKLYYEKSLFRLEPDFKNNFERLSKHVNGDPVFALVPKYVYMMGGQFRQLPNDQLEKVAIYAKKTDVSWLLINIIPWEQETMQYWDKSYDWMILDNIEKHYPELVKYCCGLFDTENGAYWMLYSFKNSD